MTDAHDETAPDAFASEVADRLEKKGRLAGMFVVREGATLRLLAALAGPAELTAVTTRLSVEDPRLPSVTALVPGADWYERELHDLYGVIPIGHPDLDPLVLPLEAESAKTEPNPVGKGRLVATSTEPLPSLVQGEGVFTIPYGPVRSGVFEAIEYVVETPGEDIPRVRTRVHYKHRGVDEVFVGRSVADGLLVAERVEGVAAVAHATAFCQAVEQICGTEIPRAAQFVRVLHAELERVANHLDSSIRHTEAAGQAVAYARLSTHKERIMRLRARLCGNRFGRGVLVPGGVNELPHLGRDELRTTLDSLEGGIRDDLELLMATPSFLDRLRGTGVIPLPVAGTHGALGPIGRGSGIEEDVRLERAYGAYRHLDLRPAFRSEGDALARQLVRIEEITSSFRLVRQAAAELERLGSGARLSVPIDATSGEAIGWAEAPQGEVLYLVRLEDGSPTRVKPRSASFHNLGLFTAAFPKDITTDFAFIEASFGLSIAGVSG